MLKFDIMNRDTLLYSIEITPEKPMVNVYTEKSVYRQFPTDTPTNDEVLDWLEDRCFPRTRANKKEILDAMGLEEYDVLDIVKYTHGLMWEDYLWVRFPGEENIKFDDIKLRD